MRNAVIVILWLAWALRIAAQPALERGTADEYRQRVASETYSKEEYAEKQREIETEYGTLPSLLRAAAESRKPRELPLKEMLEESTKRLGECYILSGKIRKQQQAGNKRPPGLAVDVGGKLLGLQISIHSGEKIERSLRAAIRSRRTVRLKVMRSPYVYLTPFGPGAMDGSLDFTVVDAQLRSSGAKFGPWLAEYPKK